MLSRHCSSIGFKLTSLFAAGLLLAVSGCGGAASTGPVTYAVKGKVTKAGQPLANVSVGFAVEGGAIEGGGETNAEGAYEAMVPAGSYKIVLSVSPPATDATDGAPSEDPVDPMAMELPFPESWTDYATSTKEVTVTEGDNTADISIE